MPRITRVGELDQQVAVDRRVETIVNGEVLVTWTEEVVLWARVEPLSAREWLAADAPQAGATHRVTIRNRPSLTAKHRLRWAGNTLNIVGPLAPSTRGDYLDILCDMGVTDGR